MDILRVAILGGGILSIFLVFAIAAVAKFKDRRRSRKERDG